MPVWSRNAVRRIRRTVKTVENQWHPKHRRPVRRQMVHGDPSLMGFLNADLPVGSSQALDLATGNPGGETNSSGKTVTAYNSLDRKLWSGSRVDVIWIAVDGASEGTGWRIAWSNSATRIMGTAASSIAPGTSGTVNIVTVIDGHLGDASVTAYSPHTNISIDSGSKVWADWVEDNDRWEIGHVDQDETGGDANVYCVDFYNNSGETIPAYALIRPTGNQRDVGGVPHVDVDKPPAANTAFRTQFLVNDSSSVADANTGKAALIGQCPVDCLVSAGTGDDIGPKQASSDWEAEYYPSNEGLYSTASDRDSGTGTVKLFQKLAPVSKVRRLRTSFTHTQTTSVESTLDMTGATNAIVNSGSQTGQGIDIPASGYWTLYGQVTCTVLWADQAFTHTEAMGTIELSLQHGDVVKAQLIQFTNGDNNKVQLTVQTMGVKLTTSDEFKLFMTVSSGFTGDPDVEVERAVMEAFCERFNS